MGEWVSGKAGKEKRKENCRVGRERERERKESEDRIG